MNCQELEGHSCLEWHPYHLRDPNLVVANCRKEVMAASIWKKAAVCNEEVVQLGDVPAYVWYVHRCCESVGDSMGTQWLAVETEEHAHYGFEDFDLPLRSIR
jgi:hypothetical protein